MSNKKKTLKGKTNKVGEAGCEVKIDVEEDRNEFIDVEKRTKNENKNSSDSMDGLRQLDVRKLRKNSKTGNHLYV